MKSYKTAAIMPAYNEELNIENAVSETKRANPDAAIILVDDGSSDRTSEVARGAGADIVLRHESNRGKGEALKSGINHVLNSMPDIEYLFIMDADLQFHPDEAGRVLAPLISGAADFVMGSRDWEHVPPRHRLGNFFWKLAFNVLFGTRLKDTNSGFVAMNRRAMEAVRNVRGGYIVENSMLAECIKQHLRIANVPVTVEYLRISKVPRGIRIFLGVFYYIVRSGIAYRLERKPR